MRSITDYQWYLDQSGSGRIYLFVFSFYTKNESMNVIVCLCKRVVRIDSFDTQRSNMVEKRPAASAEAAVSECGVRSRAFLISQIHFFSFSRWKSFPKK